MEKELLSGNEAIAQGAWEAGCAVGVGYPGTPSTETLETLVKHEEVHCEWAPNEKVALEVGLGAAIGGARTLVTMKHVGVNVAADPLMSACNTGVNAGLVVLAADDPSCYSSQNEQDSRFYASFARIPCLEPADSNDAHILSRMAFELSERFDTPVMLRETMRIAHTRTLVEVDDVATHDAIELRPYQDNIPKYVMLPANAVTRRAAVDVRTDELREFAETFELNLAEMRSTKIGVICAGAVYQHVREALPDASTFKLGLTWPLPAKALANFAASVEKCYVIEEASDYLTQQVLAMDIELAEPPAHALSRAGELTPASIRSAFGIDDPAHMAPATDLPPRPPAFCPGCPHRLVYCELRRLKAVVTGDIGCYTLGAVAPYGAVHTVIDMGASLSMAHGMELANVPERTGRPVIGVIGDSTFAHSGIESLLGTIYNGGTGTLCILDNRTTAMTGTQGNPVNGVTLTDSANGVSPLDTPSGKPLDLVALCQAMGVDSVVEVDAQDLHAIRSALKDAVAHTERLNVIIFRSPCRLVDRSRGTIPTIRDCRACGSCVKIGCPALGRDESGRAVIDATQCVGCNQCAQSCPFGCITKDETDGAGKGTGAEPTAANNTKEA